MASVRDIAKMVGVSPATVSRAINNHPAVRREVREKVITLINEKRYVSHVARRQITNIAFAYADDISLGSPFDAASTLLTPIYREISFSRDERRLDSVNP